MIAVGYHVIAILGATSLAICGIGALVGKFRATRPVEMEPSPFEVCEVYSYTAVCCSCGEPMGDVLTILDAAGYARHSGVKEAAELHAWHLSLDCTGVRA